VLVERRRVDGEPEATRQHGDDRTGHPALGRHSHCEQPASRRVVHPAAGHDAQDAAHRLVAGRARLRGRVDSAVGQRGGDHRKVAAVDLRGALPEVERQRVLGVVVPEGARALEQVRDRPVAVVGGGFGGQQAMVELEPAAGEQGVAGQDLLEVAEEAGGGDRARVDHRVERQARLRVELERVVGYARRLDVDACGDSLGTVAVERQREGHGLGDRLDREADARVAGLVALTVDGDQADAERCYVRVGELLRVGRPRPFGQRAVALEQALEVPVDDQLGPVGGRGRLHRRKRRTTPPCGALRPRPPGPTRCAARGEAPASTSARRVPASRG